MPWTVETQGAVVRETHRYFRYRPLHVRQQLSARQLRRRYDAIVSALSPSCRTFTEEERDRIFYANAKKFYRPVP